MEILLTYRGKIPSKASSVEAIWDMRKCFDRQLSKLWGKEPFDFLKKWEDTQFEAGASDFRVIVDNHTFLPYCSRKIGVGVDLDITLLTGMPEKKSVIEAGDLDNRLKRIIDGLRAPTQKGELIANLPSNSRWHCLLQDDNAVTSVSAKLGTFLASDDPSESFAFIRAKPTAFRVSLKNLAVLV